MAFYMRMLTKYPISTKISTTAVSTGLADFVSQTVFERRGLDDIEWSRTLRLSALGLCVSGPVLVGWYGALATAGTRLRLTGIKDAAFKVVADQVIFAPAFIPTFFTANILLQGKSMTDVETFLQENYFNTLKANWSVWPVAQAVNFGFVPFQHQMLFVNSVAFVWNTYLAYIASKTAAAPAPIDIDVEA